MKRPAFETMSTDDLNDWWFDTVGYDALAEGWKAEELLGLCIERFDAEQAEV